MNQHDFIARYAGIYEHSPWVAECVATIAVELADTDRLAALMADCVDNADTDKQLALICAHPDLAGKAQVAGELTAESTEEQASAGLDQCTENEYERFQALNDAYEREANPAAKDAMAQILINSRMCAEGHRPICQDTGIVTVFLNVGMDVQWQGDMSVTDMVNEGVRRAYMNPDNKLRASIMADPDGARKNTGDNTPCVIHYQIVPGDKLDVHVAAGEVPVHHATHLRVGRDQQRVDAELDRHIMPIDHLPAAILEDEALAAGVRPDQIKGLNEIRQTARDTLEAWRVILDSSVHLVPLDSLGRDTELRRFLER